MKHANRAYQDFAVRMGFFDTPQPVTFQLYSETLQKFRLSAEGVRQPVAPETHRDRILAGFDPIPSWYRPLEERRSIATAFRTMPLPSDRRHVSFVGFDECLAPPDPYRESALCTRARLRCGRPRRRRLGLGHVPPWAHQGPDQPDRCGEPDDAVDLERDRQAQAGLGPCSRCARGQVGLPAQPPDPRTAAAQRRWHAVVQFRSVTGQAAWYDLRVRIDRAEPDETSAPQFEALGTPSSTIRELRYGEEWTR